MAHLELLRALSTLAAAPLSDEGGGGGGSESDWPSSSGERGSGGSFDGSDSTTTTRLSSHERVRSVLAALRAVRRVLSRQIRHARTVSRGVVQYSRTGQIVAVVPHGGRVVLEEADQRLGEGPLGKERGGSDGSVPAVDGSSGSLMPGGVSNTVTTGPVTSQRETMDFSKLVSASCAAILRRSGDSDMNVRAVSEECFDSLVGTLCLALTYRDNGLSHSSLASSGDSHQATSARLTTPVATSEDTGVFASVSESLAQTSEANLGFHGSSIIPEAPAASLGSMEERQTPTTTLADVVLFECLRALRGRDTRSAAHGGGNAPTRYVLPEADAQGTLRCQRMALVKFGDLVARTQHETLPFVIPRSAQRKYAQAIVAALANLCPGKKNEDAWWEALAGAFSAIVANLEPFWTDNEIFRLFSALSLPAVLAHETSAIIRRSAALCLAELCSTLRANLMPRLHPILASLVVDADSGDRMPPEESASHAGGMPLLSEAQPETCRVPSALGVLQCYVFLCRRVIAEQKSDAERSAGGSKQMSAAASADITRFSLNFARHEDGNVTALALELLQLCLETFHEWNPTPSSSPETNIAFSLQDIISAMVSVVFPLLSSSDASGGPTTDVHAGDLTAINRSGLCALALSCVQALCSIASGHPQVYRSVFACFLGEDPYQLLWDSADPLIRGNASLCVAGFLESYIVAAHWSCLDAGQSVATLIRLIVDLVTNEIDASTALRLHVRACGRIVSALTSPKIRKISPLLTVQWTTTIFAAVIVRVDTQECYFGVKLEFLDVILRFFDTVHVFDACVRHLSKSKNSQTVRWDQLQSLSHGGACELRQLLLNFVQVCVEDPEIRVSEHGSRILASICGCEGGSLFNSRRLSSSKLLLETAENLLLRLSKLAARNAASSGYLLRVRAVANALTQLFERHGSRQDSSGASFRELLQNSVLSTVFDGLRANTTLHGDPSTHATLIRLCASVNPPILDDLGAYSASGVPQQPGKYTDDILKHTLRILTVIQGVENNRPVPVQDTNAAEATLLQGSDFVQDAQMLSLYAALKDLRESEIDKGAETSRDVSIQADSMSRGFFAFVFDVLNSLARFILGAGPKVAVLTYEVVTHITRWLPHPSCIDSTAAIVAAVFGSRSRSPPPQDVLATVESAVSWDLFSSEVGSVGQIGGLGVSTAREIPIHRRVRTDSTRRTQTSVVTALQPVFSRLLWAYSMTSNGRYEDSMAAFFSFISTTSLCDQFFRLDGASGQGIVSRLEEIGFVGDADLRGASQAHVARAKSVLPSVFKILVSCALRTLPIGSSDSLACQLVADRVSQICDYAFEPPAREPNPRHELLSVLDPVICLLFWTYRGIRDGEHTAVVKTRQRFVETVCRHASRARCFSCKAEIFRILFVLLKFERAEGLRIDPLESNSLLWCEHSKLAMGVVLRTIQFNSEDDDAPADTQPCSEPQDSISKAIDLAQASCALLSVMHRDAFDGISVGDVIRHCSVRPEVPTDQLADMFVVTGTTIPMCFLGAKIASVYYRDQDQQDMMELVKLQFRVVDALSQWVLPEGFSSFRWMRLLADMTHLLRQTCSTPLLFTETLSLDQFPAISTTWSGLIERFGSFASPEQILTLADALANCAAVSPRVLALLTTDPKNAHVDGRLKAVGWRTTPELRAIMLRSLVAGRTPWVSFPSLDSFLPALLAMSQPSRQRYFVQADPRLLASFCDFIPPYFQKILTEKRKATAGLNSILLFLEHIFNSSENIFVRSAVGTSLLDVAAITAGHPRIATETSQQSDYHLKVLLRRVFSRRLSIILGKVLRDLCKASFDDQESTMDILAKSSVHVQQLAVDRILPDALCETVEAYLPLLLGVLGQKLPQLHPQDHVSRISDGCGWFQLRYNQTNAESILNEALSVLPWVAVRSLLHDLIPVGGNDLIGVCCNALIQHVPNPAEIEDTAGVADWTGAVGWLACAQDVLQTRCDSQPTVMLFHVFLDTILRCLTSLDSGEVSFVNEMDICCIVNAGSEACEIALDGKLDVSDDDVRDVCCKLVNICGNLSCRCFGECWRASVFPAQWSRAFLSLSVGLFSESRRGCPVCGATGPTMMMRKSLSRFSRLLLAHPLSADVFAMAYQSQSYPMDEYETARVRNLSFELLARGVTLFGRASSAAMFRILLLCTGMGRSVMGVVSTHEMLQAVALDGMLVILLRDVLSSIGVSDSQQDGNTNSCSFCQSQIGSQLVKLFGDAATSLASSWNKLQSERTVHASTASHDHFSIPSSALGCSCPSPDVDRLATDVTVRGLSSSDQKLNESTVMRVETILLPVMSALLVLTQRPSLQRNISRGIVCLARSGILLRRPSEFTGMAPYSNDKSPVDAAMCFALFFASRVDIDFSDQVTPSVLSLPFAEAFSMLRRVTAPPAVDSTKVLCFSPDALVGDPSLQHAFSRDIIIAGGCLGVSCALEHNFLRLRRRDQSHIPPGVSLKNLYRGQLLAAPPNLLVEIISRVVRALDDAIESVLRSFPLAQTLEGVYSTDELGALVDLTEAPWADEKVRPDPCFFFRPCIGVELAACALISCRHPYFQTRVLSTLFPQFYALCLSRLSVLNAASVPFATPAVGSVLTLTSHLLRQEGFATFRVLDRKEPGFDYDTIRLPVQTFSRIVARLLSNSHTTVGLSGNSAQVRTSVMLILVRDLLLRIPPWLASHKHLDQLSVEVMMAKADAISRSSEQTKAGTKRNAMELKIPVPSLVLRSVQLDELLLPRLTQDIVDILIKGGIARNRALQRFPPGNSFRSITAIAQLTGAVYFPAISSGSISSALSPGDELQTMDNMEFAKIMLQRLPKRSFPSESAFFVHALSTMLVDVFPMDNALSLVFGELMRQLSPATVHTKTEISLQEASSAQLLVPRKSNRAPELHVAILIRLFGNVLKRDREEGWLRIEGWMLMCVENFVQLKSSIGRWALACLMLGVIGLNGAEPSNFSAPGSEYPGSNRGLCTCGTTFQPEEHWSHLSPRAARSLLKTLLPRSSRLECGEVDVVLIASTLTFLSWLSSSAAQESLLDSLPAAESETYARVHWAYRLDPKDQE